MCDASISAHHSEAAGGPDETDSIEIPKRPRRFLAVYWTVRTAVGSTSVPVLAAVPVTVFSVTAKRIKS